MKLFHTLIVILLSIGLDACSRETTSSSAKTDTYDRVMASGKIRCGYLEWPPLLQTDMATHQFSGVGVDVMNEIAKRLDLKLSWDEEVGPATAAESVKSGRVDMICQPIIITMPRVRVADFSDPVVFGRFYPWVKMTSAIAANTNMNDPRYTFVYIDGTAGMAMMDRLFPKARHLSLIENAPTSDLFQTVLTGKADAVYADASNALTFLRHNQGKIRPITYQPTAISLPWAFMMRADNYRFVQMINLTLRDIKYDGTLQRILEKNQAVDYFSLDGQTTPEQINRITK